MVEAFTKEHVLYVRITSKKSKKLKLLNIVGITHDQNKSNMEGQDLLVNYSILKVIYFLIVWY